MLEPDQVMAEAKKKENESFRFRSYLKNHADEETLGQQFHRLHQELFQDYDYNKCGFDVEMGTVLCNKHESQGNWIFFKLAFDIHFICSSDLMIARDLKPDFIFLGFLGQVSKSRNLGTYLNRVYFS